MATVNATDCVCAKSIQAGQCFVKRYGTYAYLRLSSSSLKFHGLNEHAIIGVNGYGNMCEVSPQKLVRIVPATELLKIAAEEYGWERNICGRVNEQSEVTPTFVVEAFVQEQKLTTRESRRYIEIPMDEFKAGERFRLVVEKIIPREKDPAAQDLEDCIFTWGNGSTRSFTDWLTDCFCEYEENDRPVLKVAMATSRVQELIRRGIISKDDTKLWGADLLADQNRGKYTVRLYRRKLEEPE